MKVKTQNLWFVFLTCLLCIFFSMPATAKGKPQPKNIVLNRREILLYVGETKKLSVEKVIPSKASAKVVWKSKKKSIASVSPKGLVTAKKAGTTRITASSRKNPKVNAFIKVIVKKRPKKVEKECTVTGKTYLNSPYIKENHLVIRSREDIDELLKKMVKDGFYKKSYREALKSSPLAAYRNMNFEKETLILLETYREEKELITSCKTKLDANGKLQAVVTFPYKMRDPDLPPLPPTLSIYTLALRLDKKDAAMIDYYTLDYQEIP
ncbi:Ig-like domain-containing protein [Lachnospiraceae bacterium 46-15]